MKEFLKQIANDKYDGIRFFRNTEGIVEAHTFSYKEKGELINMSSIGGYYDIILYSENETNEPDRFKAILTSHLDYISGLIDNNIFGIISKVTTTSHLMMDEIYDDLLNTYNMRKESENASEV